MTKEKLRSIMDKHKLSQTDIAAITGKTVRQVYSWLSGVHTVPRSLAIILYALDEGKITPTNIVSWISRK